MTRCAYIYTSEGVRLPEDRVTVLVEMNGEPVRLKLVRSGKGRSRIDRWPNGAGPDGSTGEINTRDLREWQENGTLSLYNAFYKTQSDEMAIISLDLNNVIGRGGREKSPEETLRGITRYAELSGRGMNVPENWMLDALLRYAPYGMENSDDYREVLDAILPSESSATYQFLTPASVIELIKSGATNFLLHCSDDHIEYISSLRGVDEYIHEASDVEPGTKERIDSAIKINETVSYLREGGRELSYIIGKKSLSVKELFRVSRRGTWDIFEHMAEAFPSEVLSYIESSDVRGNTGAVMFLIAMHRAGKPVTLESIEKVSTMLYVDPEGYNEHLNMLSDLAAISNTTGSYKWGDFSYHLTKDLLSCVAPVSPVVLHALASLPSSRGSYRIKDACRTASENLLTESLKHGSSKEWHVTYSLEALLKTGISSGYDAHSVARHLRPVSLLGRVNESRTDSLMYEALSITPDEQVMRILSSDEEQRTRGRSFSESGVSSISRRGVIMTTAACCLRMPEYFSAYVSRMERDDTPNIAAGVFYSTVGTGDLDGWFRENIGERLLGTATPWGRYDSAHEESDERAIVAAVIAKAVMSGGHTNSVSQVLQMASDDHSKKSMRSLFKTSDTVWQDPEIVVGDTKREARETVRIGIALGTDDVELLTSIMNDERDYAAGPIAAMRLSGHPDVTPLSKHVPSDVKKQATEKLGKTLSARGIYFVETVERAVSVTRALLGGTGQPSK